MNDRYLTKQSRFFSNVEQKLLFTATIFGIIAISIFFIKFISFDNLTIFGFTEQAVVSGLLTTSILTAIMTTIILIFASIAKDITTMINNKMELDEYNSIIQEQQSRNLQFDDIMKAWNIKSKLNLKNNNFDS